MLIIAEDGKWDMEVTGDTIFSKSIFMINVKICKFLEL